MIPETPNINENSSLDEKDLSKNNSTKKNITETELSETPGMDMGTDFKEEKEQDLDDLVHKQNSSKANVIPPPEES